MANSALETGQNTITRCKRGHELNDQTVYIYRNQWGEYRVCRECAKQSASAWRQANRERYRQLHRAAEQTEPRRARRKKAARRRQLSTYGLTEASYQAMLDEQGHQCPICGVEIGEVLQRGADGRQCLTRNTAVVDHCHETNVVRGLLCPLCNRLLGEANDEPATLRRAADYLERTSKTS